VIKINGLKVWPSLQLIALKPYKIIKINVLDFFRVLGLGFHEWKKCYFLVCKGKDLTFLV
jgi:hypothetical protein